MSLFGSGFGGILPQFGAVGAGLNLAGVPLPSMTPGAFSVPGMQQIPTTPDQSAPSPGGLQGGLQALLAHLGQKDPTTGQTGWDQIGAMGKSLQSGAQPQAHPMMPDLSAYLMQQPMRHPVQQMGLFSSPFMQGMR